MSSEKWLEIFPSRFIPIYTQNLSPHTSLIHHNCHNHNSVDGVPLSFTSRSVSKFGRNCSS